MKNKIISSALIFMAMIYTVDAQQTSGGGFVPNGNGNSVSQGSTPTGYISFNFGNCTPLGAYGAATTSSTAGWATSGGVISLSEASCIAHSNFGIAAKLDVFVNSFDVQSYANVATTQTPGLTWSASTLGNYVGINLLIGAYATIPVHKFAFDFRVMGGYMLASLPAISISSIDSYGNNAVFGNDAANSSAFAFDLGANIRWNITNHFCLLIAYDYVFANQSFTTNSQETITDINGNVTNYPESVIVKQPISIFNATLGIGIVLGRK